MSLPRDIEAEKAVLGAILLDNGQLKEVVNQIGINDLYSPASQIIFAAMLAADADGDPVDPVTVGSRLAEGDLSAIGGALTLSNLLDVAVAPSSASLHAARIKKCSIKRDGMIAAEKIGKLVSSDNVDSEKVAKLIDKIRAAESLDQKNSRTAKLSSGVGIALEGFKRFEAGQDSDRTPVGVYKIDRALRGGMMAGALYLIGAPPGGGKTTLLQAVAVNCAKSRGPVLFVSPEMATHELSEREIIRRSGVPLDRRGPWVSWDEQRENEALHTRAAMEIEAEGLEVHCIDEPAIKMSDVAAMARRIKGIRLIIVDYAQETADPDPRIARYIAVGAVGRDSIRLAKELHCPVFVASQVNKSPKGEYTFRESGDLHQRAHASMIMESKWSEIPNRNGYFDIESTKIFSLKNRSGPGFSVPINYEPSTYRIGEFKAESSVWTPKEVATNGY